MLYPKEPRCLEIKMATILWDSELLSRKNGGYHSSELVSFWVQGGSSGVTLILNPLKLIVFFFLAACRISFLSQLS